MYRYLGFLNLCNGRTKIYDIPSRRAHVWLVISLSGGMVIAQVLRSAHEVTVAPVRASSFEQPEQQQRQQENNKG